MAVAAFVIVCLLGSIIQSRADPPAGKRCSYAGGDVPACVCKHHYGVLDLRPLAFNNNTAR